MILMSSASGVSLFSSAGGVRQIHHPAARILARVFKANGLLFLEQLEGGAPEMEFQNLAFLRQQVVFDVQAQHRFQMRADDGGGDQFRHGRGFAVAFFDVFQRLGAPFSELPCSSS